MALLVHRDGRETLADILAPGLDVLFCGYNPACFAVERRHYYARTANRFWEDLHEAGFTPRPLRGPDEDLLLPAFGVGLTDLVKRPSPNIDDLEASDYTAGAARLDGLLTRYRPRILCFNGLGLLPAYTRAGRPPADVEVLCLPSTSPRNQRLRVERLAAFRALKARVDALPGPRAAGAGLRPARPAEAAWLTDLAFASKASWGYDAAFMAACREALTVDAAAIATGRVWAPGWGDRPEGFYGLAPDPADPAALDLTWLFVAPGAQRQGLGRRLLVHARAVARAEGFARLTIESDPHAEAFYLAAGARRVGEAPSPAGRLLPKLVLDA